MQPDDMYHMSVPEGKDPRLAATKGSYKVPPLEARWSNGIPFKEFHRNTIKYYSEKS